MKSAQWFKGGLEFSAIFCRSFMQYRMPSFGVQSRKHVINFYEFFFDDFYSFVNVKKKMEFIGFEDKSEN